jgi:hypothetical protein
MSLKYGVLSFKFVKTKGKIREGGEVFKGCRRRNAEPPTMVDSSGLPWVSSETDGSYGFEKMESGRTECVDDV